MIQQGDLFWIDLEEPVASSPGYRRPHIVVQNNRMNHSQIHTVIVCALTTNLRRAKAPGNVLLELGEADLPEQSVVNVSQLFTVDKSKLEEKIGTLSVERVGQILEGIRLLTDPLEPA